MPQRAPIDRLRQLEEDPSLLPALMSLSRACRQLMQIRLAEVGVVVGQDQLIDLLTPDRTITVSELAHQLNVRPSTVSKMLDRIVAQGWAARETDDRDARRTSIRLTAEGAEPQRRIREIWSAMDEDLIAGLAAEEEVQTTCEALHRIADVLSQRLSRLR